YIVFIRPQVNSFQSHLDPGATGIWLKGNEDAPVQLMGIVAADVEGELGAAIRLEHADHNRIEIAAIAARPPTIGVSLDSQSSFNTVVSAHDRVTLSVASPNGNMFMGLFDSTDETLMSGLYW